MAESAREWSRPGPLFPVLSYRIGLEAKTLHRLEGRVVRKGRGGQAVGAGGMGRGKEGQCESQPSGE